MSREDLHMWWKVKSFPFLVFFWQLLTFSFSFSSFSFLLFFDPVLVEEKKKALEQKIVETSFLRDASVAQQEKFVVNAKLVQGKRYIVPR